MITESGRVVAVESDGIWVETANQSTCGSCSARKGCGQSLLAQLEGHRSYIKAAFNGYPAGDFAEGLNVTIGIHETAVVRGSLLLYGAPLLGLVAGAWAGDALALPDGWVALAALAGLALTGAAVRLFTRHHANDQRYQPLVVAVGRQQPEQPVELT